MWRSVVWKCVSVCLYLKKKSRSQIAGGNKPIIAQQETAVVYQTTVVWPPSALLSQLYFTLQLRRRLFGETTVVCSQNFPLQFHQFTAITVVDSPPVLLLFSVVLTHIQRCYLQVLYKCVSRVAGLGSTVHGAPELGQAAAPVSAALRCTCSSSLPRSARAALELPGVQSRQG